MTAHDYYQTLKTLRVGDSVPVTMLILDYKDNTRPVWIVVDKKEIGGNGMQITLEDRDNKDMFDSIRVIVLSFPSKILRTPAQPHGTAPAVIGPKLCDLAQQSRYGAKRNVHNH